MTLTEEILGNISAYRMESIDAEIDTLEAHMEACLRDAQVRKECEDLGIVMEGDILPERGDENIVKYILLFIPRLVINILRKLREWITGEHIPTAEELKKQQEEEKKKAAEEADAETLLSARKMVADQINASKSKVYTSSNGYLVGTGDGYTYKWAVNITQTKQLYEAYEKYFAEYLEVFNKLFDKNDVDVDEELTNFEKELAIMVSTNNTDGVFSPSPSYTLVDNGSIDSIINGKNNVLDQMGKHIESMMNQLIKTYHDMDQDKKVSNSNMRFAANYMSSIKVIYAKFSAFNSRLGTEIAAAQYALKNIKPVSKAMFDKIAESKPEMAEKYKERGFV
jgi:hypothetical protein